jgi:hypothetical protein
MGKLVLRKTIFRNMIDRVLASLSHGCTHPHTALLLETFSCFLVSGILLAFSSHNLVVLAL